MKAIQLTLLSLSLVGFMSGTAVKADDEPGQNMSDSQDEATIIAEAQGGAGGNGGHHHGGWHRPGGMMGLTDDQLSKLADIREGVREKTASQRAQLEALKYQLHKAMMQPAIDKSAAMALQSKINALHGEIANARLAGHIDAMGVFTPEQREHMRHFMLMRSAMRGMGGHHGHDGPCGAECGGGHHGFGGHPGVMMRHHMEGHHEGPPHGPEGEPDGGAH